MRIYRKLVLLLARDAVLLGNVLAGDPHVVVVVNIPQAVADHGIDYLRVAETESFARLRQKIRGVGHRLHAAGYNYCAIAGFDSLLGKRDGFQS